MYAQGQGHKPKSNEKSFQTIPSNEYVLILYVPVNSYGHAGIVSSANHTF